MTSIRCLQNISWFLWISIIHQRVSMVTANALPPDGALTKPVIPNTDFRTPGEPADIKLEESPRMLVRRREEVGMAVKENVAGSPNPLAVQDLLLRSRLPARIEHLLRQNEKIANLPERTEHQLRPREEISILPERIEYQLRPSEEISNLAYMGEILENRNEQRIENQLRPREEISNLAYMGESLENRNQQRTENQLIPREEISNLAYMGESLENRNQQRTENQLIPREEISNLAYMGESLENRNEQRTENQLRPREEIFNLAYMGESLENIKEQRIEQQLRPREDIYNLAYMGESLENRNEQFQAPQTPAPTRLSVETIGGVGNPSLQGIPISLGDELTYVVPSSSGIATPKPVYGGVGGDFHPVSIDTSGVTKKITDIDFISIPNKSPHHLVTPALNPGELLTVLASSLPSNSPGQQLAPNNRPISIGSLISLVKNLTYASETNSYPAKSKPSPYVVNPNSHSFPENTNSFPNLYSPQHSSLQLPQQINPSHLDYYLQQEYLRSNAFQQSPNSIYRETPAQTAVHFPESASSLLQNSPAHVLNSFNYFLNASQRDAESSYPLSSSFKESTTGGIDGIQGCLSDTWCGLGIAAAVAIGTVSALAVPFLTPTFFGRRRRSIEYVLFSADTANSFANHYMSLQNNDSSNVPESEELLFIGLHDSNDDSARTVFKKMEQFILSNKEMFLNMTYQETGREKDIPNDKKHILIPDEILRKISKNNSNHNYSGIRKTIPILETQAETLPVLENRDGAIDQQDEKEILKRIQQNDIPWPLSNLPSKPPPKPLFYSSSFFKTPASSVFKDYDTYDMELPRDNVFVNQSLQKVPNLFSEYFPKLTSLRNATLSTIFRDYNTGNAGQVSGHLSQNPDPKLPFSPGLQSQQFENNPQFLNTGTKLPASADLQSQQLGNNIQSPNAKPKLPISHDMLSEHFINSLQLFLRPSPPVPHRNQHLPQGMSFNQEFLQSNGGLFTGHSHAHSPTNTGYPNGPSTLNPQSMSHPTLHNRFNPFDYYSDYAQGSNINHQSHIRQGQTQASFGNFKNPNPPFQNQNPAVTNRFDRKPFVPHNSNRIPINTVDNQFSTPNHHNNVPVNNAGQQISPLSTSNSNSLAEPPKEVLSLVNSGYPSILHNLPLPLNSLNQALQPSNLNISNLSHRNTKHPLTLAELQSFLRNRYPSRINHPSSTLQSQVPNPSQPVQSNPVPSSISAPNTSFLPPGAYPTNLPQLFNKDYYNPDSNNYHPNDYYSTGSNNYRPDDHYSTDSNSYRPNDHYSPSPNNNHPNPQGNNIMIVPLRNNRPDISLQAKGFYSSVCSAVGSNDVPDSNIIRFIREKCTIFQYTGII